MNFFSKRDDAESGSTEQRLRGLEVKINLLITLVLIQICVSLYLAVQTLFPSWTTMIIMGLLVISIGWIFRKQLPAWAGLATRKLLRSDRPSSSSDSETDSRAKAENFD